MLGFFLLPTVIKPIVFVLKVNLSFIAVTLVCFFIFTTGKPALYFYSTFGNVICFFLSSIHRARFFSLLLFFLTRKTIQFVLCTQIVNFIYVHVFFADSFVN